MRIDSLSLIQKKIDRSLSIIKKMLELCKNPYIALSFGKDSLVMMDLIYQVDSTIECIFMYGDETDYISNFKELEQHYKNTHNLNLTKIKSADIISEFSIEEVKKERKKDWFKNDLISKDGVFMGLRIEESTARRITIIKNENNIHDRIMKYKTGVRLGQYRCCPVADWSTFDIEIYVKSKKLKMLDIYEKLGIQERTSARIPRSATVNKFKEQIKRVNPEKYNLLLKNLPELSFFN
jgi:3'-phosphoadenosine 5'-phosphosulfate sulfotransferase (PAPS reductase)/FAD synthetase